MVEAHLARLHDARLVDPVAADLLVGQAGLQAVEILVAEDVAVFEQPPLVRADDGAHAAIFQIGILQGDPGGTHIGGAGRLPVPVVLAPADIARGFLSAVRADAYTTDIILHS